MKYDFDRVVDRRGTYSIKWEVEPSELPMWVADVLLRLQICTDYHRITHT